MMNAEPADLFSLQTESGQSPGELLFEIELPGRLPSWNDILGMEQWARYQFKRELADLFLSELRRSAGDCSTRTTCARNTMLTFAATLERYLATQQAKRKSKSDRKRLEAKSASLFASKSSRSPKFVPTLPPPF